MKPQGGKMVDTIFFVTLALMAVFGAWKYYSAETNTFNQLVQKIEGMQNEIHSNADLTAEIQESIRLLKNRVENLEHKSKENETKIETGLKEANAEIDLAQDHLALIRKEVQRIDARPDRLELVLDTPNKPIPVQVESKNTGLRTLVTKKKIIKNKNAKGKWDGSWTVFQKSIARPYIKRKDNPVPKEPKAPMPGATKAKQAMTAAQL